MKPFRIFRSGVFTPPFLWAIVAAAVLGTVLILFREINYGVGVNADGAGYLIRARRMLAGPGWLVHLSGDQPPFYPLLLALVGLPGFDLRHVAGVVNATVFGLTILFVSLYLSTRLQSRLLGVWATLATTLSPPLTILAAQVSTEPAMVLFSLLALIHVEKFLDRSAYVSLIWAAICSALAGLTRYTGIFVAPAIVLLLLFRGDIPISEKIRQVVIYSFISLTPICLFLLRNYLLSGLFFWYSEGWPSYTPTIENLRSWLIALASWILPVSDIWSSGVGIQRTVGFAFPPLVSLITAGYLFLRLSPKSDARIESNPNSMALFTYYSLVYVALLIAATFLRNIEPENAGRYLAPVYVPLVIIVSLAANRLLKDFSMTKGGVHPVARKDWNGNPIGTVLISSMLLWLCYPIAENARAAIVHINQGLGYASERWRNSDVIRYLEDHPVDDPVYSNETSKLKLSGLRTIPYKTLDQLMSKPRPPLHIVHFNARLYQSGRRGERTIGPWPDIVFSHGRSKRPPSVESVFSGIDGGVHRFSLRGRSDLGEIIRETKPVICSDYYDVYLDGNRLIYARSTAVPHDATPSSLRFFLHIVPVETKHLRWDRKWLGRRQIDWSEDCSWRSDGKCVVVVGLPAYEIRSIRTGQYLAGTNKTYGDLTWWRAIAVVWDFITTGRFALEDHIWEGEFSFVHERRY